MVFYLCDEGVNRNVSALFLYQKIPMEFADLILTEYR